ncbi:TPA: hypothetical protein DDW35_00050 [Candidatus Sumerlaeota bacterium]|nr:hypothetical protein [Candidatus Sumerlaeota bacterium]
MRRIIYGVLLALLTSSTIACQYGWLKPAGASVEAPPKQAISTPTPRSTTVENKSSEKLQVVVNLRDGSILKGVCQQQLLPVRSLFGSVAIPLTLLNKVTMQPDRERATILFTNGDRLTGIPEGKTLDLASDAGDVTIPIVNIQEMTMSGARNVLGAQAKTWNMTQDFSTSINPNGTWSYGWVSAPHGGVFMPFPRGDGQGEAPGAIGWFLQLPGQNVWINRSDKSLCGVVPGQVSLHPGPHGEHAAVRWTSPATGRVSVRGKFGAGDVGPVDVYVLCNGQQRLQSSNARADAPFDISVQVKPGDTIDFLVGCTQWGCNNTPLDVTISLQ